MLRAYKGHFSYITFAKRWPRCYKNYFWIYDRQMRLLPATSWASSRSLPASTCHTIPWITLWWVVSQMVRVAIKSRDVLKKLHPIKHRLVPDLLEKVIRQIEPTFSWLIFFKECKMTLFWKFCSFDESINEWDSNVVFPFLDRIYFETSRCMEKYHNLQKCRKEPCRYVK